MRVAAIVPAYPPHSRVGAWLATHRFLVRLVERGHQVDVFTSARRHPITVVDGVTVGPAVNLDLAVAASDVVISHLGDTQRAAALAAKWRRPSVRFGHGGVVSPESVAGAALLVFNSEAFRSEVPHGCPSIVAHPPIDVDEYRTIPGDRVTLVNLSEAKGGDLFWRLARAMPDRLFLGVRGGYGAQLHERRSNVETHPCTSDMRSVYRRTRILLMPSKHETWGMTGVEAMCSGIPVIAHPTPGLVESLGDAGIFVDRDNGQGWIDAIRSLDDPAAYGAASTAARARFAEIPDHRARFVDALEALCG